MQGALNMQYYYYLFCEGKHTDADASTQYYSKKYLSQKINMLLCSPNYM